MERRFTPERRAVSRGGRRVAERRGRPIVLIVDDHVDSRELLATVLQQADVLVAEAGTGQEAAARIAGYPPPNLILIDLALPDCHGTAIVRMVKENERTRDIPVVALSASVMAADKEGARQAGCLAFIEKPVMPDHVLSIVCRLLSIAGAPGLLLLAFAQLPA